jgi:hypothetical protein
MARNPTAETYIFAGYIFNKLLETGEATRFSDYPVLLASLSSLTNDSVPY